MPLWCHQVSCRLSAVFFKWTSTWHAIRRVRRPRLVSKLSAWRSWAARKASRAADCTKRLSLAARKVEITALRRGFGILCSSKCQSISASWTARCSCVEAAIAQMRCGRSMATWRRAMERASWALLASTASRHAFAYISCRRAFLRWTGMLRSVHSLQQLSLLASIVAMQVRYHTAMAKWTKHLEVRKILSQLATTAAAEKPYRELRGAIHLWRAASGGRRLIEQRASANRMAAAAAAAGRLRAQRDLAALSSRAPESPRAGTRPRAAEPWAMAVGALAPTPRKPQTALLSGSVRQQHACAARAAVLRYQEHIKTRVPQLEGRIHAGLPDLFAEGCKHPPRVQASVCWQPQTELECALSRPLAPLNPHEVQLRHRKAHSRVRASPAPTTGPLSNVGDRCPLPNLNSELQVRPIGSYYL